MPRIFRVMKPLDGKPEVGNSSCMLGARERDLGRAEAATDDFVDPAKAGLSVGGCVRTTYLNILPRRLQTLYPQWARGAKGRNSDQVWAMGQGKYETAPISADLDLRFQTEDRPGHGLVAPNRKMLLEEYQAALAATQDQWKVDEEHSDDCPVCRQFGIS
jgi:hypothetical protein